MYGLNAALPEVQDQVQDGTTGDIEAGYFFRGFKKRAAMTHQRSGFSAGTGPRAKALTTTASAFKPIPTPSPTPAPAKDNMATKL